MSKSGKLDSGPENYCSKQMEFKLPNLQIAPPAPHFSLSFFCLQTSAAFQDAAESSHIELKWSRLFSS